MQGIDKLIKRAPLFAPLNATISTLVALQEKAIEQHPQLVRVLTYHRVENREGFAQQANYLASSHHVISMLELLEACERGTTLPPRSVLITFDDAYHNFAQHAWPVLKRYRLPVTLFVPTAFPDDPERGFWWDRLEQAVATTRRRDELDTPLGRLPLAQPNQRDQAFRRLRDYVKALPHSKAMTLVEQICSELDVPPAPHRVLGWDELRQLAREGVTLGAHSRTHPLMDRISIEEARSEAIGSLHDLEREIGPVPPIFAYPGGTFNDTIAEVLAHAGFALAFTTVRGTNILGEADRLQLRRNNIGQRATVGVLRARLLQSSVYLNRLRPV